MVTAWASRRSLTTTSDQAIRMFYEDDSVYPRHVEAISSDGVHFTYAGHANHQRAGSDGLTWGDMAYDPG